MANAARLGSVVRPKLADDPRPTAFEREIRGDTDYALNYIVSYEDTCRAFGLSLDGLRILELGPGKNFGPQLVLASRGADVTLADRFLCAWGEGYHPAAYRALRDRLEEPAHHLELAIEGGHDVTPLRLLPEPAEALAAIPDGTIDLVFSNAVLEHIFDIERVCAEMKRVVRPGGHASHQIDLRYHYQDFQRPLEHLIVSDAEHRAEAAASNLECGNRLRSIEFLAHFESAGFQVVLREVNGRCEPSYYEDALLRLRASSSCYSRWPANDLWRIGCRFMLRKEEGAAADEIRARGADALEMIAEIKNRTHSTNAGLPRSWVDRLAATLGLGGRRNDATSN